jgi:hypothetical protein
MSHLYYTFIVSLVTVSLYRPFITKLDQMKYILLGTASFLIPFTVDNHISNQSTFSVSRNSTSVYALATPPSPTSIFNNSNSHTCLWVDAITLSLLTALTVSICGLFTRWHFPITFIKPNPSTYLSGFMRHGISIAIILLATWR